MYRIVTLKNIKATITNKGQDVELEIPAAPYGVEQEDAMKQLQEAFNLTPHERDEVFDAISNAQVLSYLRKAVENR